MAPKWIKIMYAIAGTYDFLLGLVFLVFGTRIYAIEHLTPPNHIAYFQFPALLLIMFGVMFFQIAGSPVKYRELMPYGMGLKVAFCSVVLGHAAAGDMPNLWIPFAWMDLGFLILFVFAWNLTKPIKAV